MDIARTPEWVTICRAVLHLDDGEPRPGWQCRQRYVLRGAPFVVTWTLDGVEPDRYIRWTGRGPARSTAFIAQHLEPLPNGGTRLRYVNEFKAPGGLLGAAASRALVGDTAEHEAGSRLGNSPRSWTTDHTRHQCVTQADRCRRSQHMV